MINTLIWVSVCGNGWVYNINNNQFITTQVSLYLSTLTWIISISHYKISRIFKFKSTSHKNNWFGAISFYPLWKTRRFPESNILNLNLWLGFLKKVIVCSDINCVISISHLLFIFFPLPFSYHGIKVNQLRKQLIWCH